VPQSPLSHASLAPRPAPVVTGAPALELDEAGPLPLALAPPPAPSSPRPPPLGELEHATDEIASAAPSVRVQPLMQDLRSGASLRTANVELQRARRWWCVADVGDDLSVELRGIEPLTS